MKKQTIEIVVGIIVIILVVAGLVLLKNEMSGGGQLTKIADVIGILQSNLHDTISVVGSLLDIVKDHSAKLDSLEARIIILENQVSDLNVVYWGGDGYLTIPIDGSLKTGIGGE